MRRDKDNNESVMPWLDYVAPAKRDIDLQVSSAPSLDDLDKERLTRINLLRRSGRALHREIADKLARVPAGQPAMTAACPLFVRKWQVYVASRMSKAFKAFSNDQIYMVTIADRQTLTLSEFNEFDIRKFKSRLRKRLERHLPAKAVVFGVCEFAFDAQTHNFLPHCHLFIAGVPRPFLEGLKQHYLPERNYGVKSLMRIDAVTDLLRQLSYALKTVIYRRPQRIDGRRPKGKRLRMPYFRAHMTYLDQHKLGDFLFCKNARLHSRKPVQQPARPLTKEALGRAIFNHWLARNT